MYVCAYFIFALSYFYIFSLQSKGNPHYPGNQLSAYYTDKYWMLEVSQLIGLSLSMLLTPPRGCTQLFFQVWCAAWISEVWDLRTDICLWKRGLVNWKFPKFGGLWTENFQIWGLVNWKFPKFGGLWTENFQIWGLVNWKFPNLGAYELKTFKSGGLWAKIWVKIEAVEAKISKFSQKGVLWTDTFAWNETLANYRRDVKGGLQGRTSPF